MNPSIIDALSKCQIGLETILGSWQNLVEIESYTHHPKAVAKLCGFVENKLNDLGVTTQVHHFENAGPLLIGHYGSGPISDGIILAGHMDTVFEDDFIKSNPFRVEDDQVYGPGVLDMKGGLNLIFYIIQILKALNYTKPIKIILSGDEENGHLHSDQNLLIEQESRGYKLAFNLETGLIDNKITIARKGRLACRVATKGLAVHAGANLEDGINAIHEMAYKILKIQDLNQKYDNVTFSVGKIKGGTVPNAVPDYAEIDVDIRYEKDHLKQHIVNDLNDIISVNHVSGATSEVFFDNEFPPFEDRYNQKAFEFIRNISAKNGLGEIAPVKLGGSSDASFISRAGIPCLCSMGVKGQWNHSNREYALASSAAERLVLIVDSILEAEKVESFL
ncbi:MAG: M20/M25/M40 family metallo-hydrolase [Acidaminobacter sp.]|uniref:M20/M25/M40 family metallo-hydrolase n=1 Tax=Acidaminobacter sp. TaxID=1872102 RepID=UPI00137E8DA0|nr:M20/M25/M40 family metallo-hydrolase [Acidaminobacter sp.]MZQ98152.1 M20/M25/M40 family metallo-hydrolase [Acidaminobacter sp.]